ncbi:hypothetical protein ACLOJK_011627 [Asimina triloba]
MNAVHLVNSIPWQPNARNSIGLVSSIPPRSACAWNLRPGENGWKVHGLKIMTGKLHQSICDRMARDWLCSVSRRERFSGRGPFRREEMVVHGLDRQLMLTDLHCTKNNPTMANANERTFEDECRPEIEMKGGNSSNGLELVGRSSGDELGYSEDSSQGLKRREEHNLSFF